MILATNFTKIAENMKIIYYCCWIASSVVLSCHTIPIIRLECLKQLRFPQFNDNSTFKMLRNWMLRFILSKVAIFFDDIWLSKWAQVSWFCAPGCKESSGAFLGSKLFDISKGNYRTFGQHNCETLTKPMKTRQKRNFFVKAMVFLSFSCIALIGPQVGGALLLCHFSKIKIE